MLEFLDREFFTTYLSRIGDGGNGKNVLFSMFLGF